jgi:hypothetical protein
LYPTDPNKVLEIIISLPNTDSDGHDEIPKTIIKNVPNIFVNLYHTLIMNPQQEFFLRNLK